MSSRPEVWLRGPVDGVPALLQPAAHALLQEAEEVEAAVEGLGRLELWVRPGGAASIGFHLKHLAGSIDRLLTYARSEQLDDAQRAWLAAESMPGDETAEELAAMVGRAVERALAQLRATDPATLLDPREVGRGRLPSTVLGLLFHAAEHGHRHVGQIVTLAKIVRGRGAEGVPAG